MESANASQPTTASLRIARYEPRWKSDVLRIWEDSVKATHHFLSAADFERLKEIVGGFDFSSINLYCALVDEKPVAFVGVQDGKVEMLFASPAVIGTGVGKALLRFATEALRATKVDVNAQNERAAAFYKKHGFETYETTGKDDLGLPYSLLRMKLRGK